MKKVIRTLLIMGSVMCVSWASVMVIFAKNSDVSRSEDLLANVTNTVNPHMAVIAAVIVCIVGIAVFIKRNKENE